MPRMLLFGLLVLAVVATVLMLFLNSELWLKIAVFCALWAAFIGAWLASRYSSALAAERDTITSLQRAHEAELEKERSDAKQREVQLESGYAERMRTQRDEHLEQLRQELEIMRQQLTSLTGKVFGEEQLSVHAKAQRVREIENKTGEELPLHLRTSTEEQPPRTAARQEDAFIPGHVRTSTAEPESSRTQRHEDGQRAGVQAFKEPQQYSGTQPDGEAARSQNAAEASAQPHGRAHNKPQFSTGSFAAITWGGQDGEATTELPLIVDTTALEDEEPRAHRSVPTSHTQSNTAHWGAHSAGAARAGTAGNAGTASADTAEVVRPYSSPENNPRTQASRTQASRTEAPHTSGAHERVMPQPEYGDRSAQRSSFERFAHPQPVSSLLEQSEQHQPLPHQPQPPAQSRFQPRSGGHHRRDEEPAKNSLRGRRRADEASAGLTVAQLMERFKS